MQTLACSPDSYSKIIAVALSEGYRFGTFSGVLRDKGSDDLIIILRHDVDFSVEMAAKLAEINAAFGVVGTFFVQVRSPVYNLLCRDSIASLERISRCGQKLGLHLSYPEGIGPPSAIGAQIESDLRLCEKESSLEFERVVAWHNPRPELIDNQGLLEGTCFESAYNAPFFKRGHYFSDSNLRNTPDDFVEIISARRQSFLQLLFHPCYWIGGGAAVEPILKRTMVQVIREKEREFRTNPNWAGLRVEEV